MLGGYPQDGSGLDKLFILLIATFVDGRAFPLFGLLFGYGVAQIARRQSEAGRDPRGVRRLLWRRSLFLVVLGFVDAMLFYVGDILAAYGVLLFLGVWAIRWKARTLLVVAALFLRTDLAAGRRLAGDQRGRTRRLRCCRRSCSRPSKRGSRLLR